MPHPAIATEDRRKGQKRGPVSESTAVSSEKGWTPFSDIPRAVSDLRLSITVRSAMYWPAEQGAIHMAEGYARVTGKPGVVIATSGPGATNLVTGIANAYMDSIPLVCITGNVPQNLIGTDAFQEADITGITMPITKHNYFVTDVRDLARVVKEAFVIASTGRPGPVLIDIPKDVSNAKAALKFPDKVFIRGYQPTTDPHPLQVQKLKAAIAKAGPVISRRRRGRRRPGAEGLCRASADSRGDDLMGIGGFDIIRFGGHAGMHPGRMPPTALLECDR